VPIEMLFNVTVIALFFVLRRNHKLPGQHFHLIWLAMASFASRTSLRAKNRASSARLPDTRSQRSRWAALGVAGFALRRRSMSIVPARTQEF